MTATQLQRPPAPPRRRQGPAAARNSIWDAGPMTKVVLALACVLLLASLYPAVTVVLAATVLREHVHRTQAAGLVLCGVAVALVVAG